MATTTKAAAPARKKSGFGGVKNAIWIIVICAVISHIVFYAWFGHSSHFVGGDNTGHPLPGDMWGTVFKGGWVVPIIFTLLTSVFCLGVERWLALRSAFGTMSLGKFTIQVKELIKASKFDEAEKLCDKMKGSVANVVMASIRAYKDVESLQGVKKAQKISKIQQAHEEATQLEMPTLQMNLPIVATIVTLGTLTALFGTVLGMIRSFAALSSGGGADSAALSEGISEALVNTASGILTSWIAVVVYNFFTNKIDKLTYALDEVGYTIASTYDVNHADEI